MIGPLINIPAVSNANMICRSFVEHSARSLILSQIKSPIANMTSASGTSYGTSVASRGVSRLKPNPASAITPAVIPDARDALRNNKNAIAAAHRNGGNRHAISQDRVTENTAADIHPVNGGL